MKMLKNKERVMISFIVLIFMTLASLAQDCPLQGVGRNEKEKRLNTEKNRSCEQPTVSTYVHLISIDSILKQGNDITRFQVGELVAIEGYVILQKYGGSESCNCHAKTKDGWDVHLEVAKNKNDKGVNSFICEVTPKYLNRSSVDWKSLVGKKVRFIGYLFFDEEHKQNAVTTNPNGTNLWRCTCWEIHPVIDFKVIE